ncbi:MAG: TonB-dependent siderophore receptor [Zoogloeaceae bacterium]|nr:TonB-dependent siderophore receptor [Zoogloeaceae bacterium]
MNNAASGSETVLPEVFVNAEANGSGALPPAYEGGQVATGGRVGLLGNKDFMETPLNVIGYTEQFIQDTQAREISRVIALTDPGVYINTTSGMLTEQFSIRGFGVSANDISINGLYGMAPYWRVTPEMAERVEVLKGPSALLNGMPPTGSVGGSVNLVPKRAGKTPIARLTTNYMSDSQWGGHVDIGQRFGENQQFGVRFNGVYRNGGTAVKHQEKKTQLASLGLDWRSDRIRLSADMYRSEDYTRGLNRGVSLNPGVAVPKPPKPETLLGPGWTFGKTKDRAIMARGEFDIAERLMVYAAFGDSHTDFDALASSTYTIYNAAGDFRNNFAHQRIILDKTSAEIGARGKFSTGVVEHEVALTATRYAHDYHFGFLRNVLPADWITNIYHPVWGPAIDTGFSHAHLPRTAQLRLTGVAIADTLSFVDGRAQLTLGARRQEVLEKGTPYDTTGSSTARYDESAITPAILLLVKITPRLSAYGNYIEGLSQGATAPLNAANAGEVFAPYKSKQKEIGLKLDTGRLAVTASLFQITRPSAYTDPVSNIYSFGGEQRNRGIEIGFFGAPRNDLRLMGGLSYTEARLTKTAGGVNEGKLATGIPKWQAKLGVEWDIRAVPGLTLTGNAVAVSRQYISADNHLSVPGHTIYDLGARYLTRVGDFPLVFRADIRNVGNKAYWAGTLWEGLGEPRTFLFSATVDF